MRPTPEGVGNSATRLRCVLANIASMRPTPEGVGNRRRCSSASAADTGFNEAHARRRGKSTCVHHATWTMRVLQ